MKKIPTIYQNNFSVVVSGAVETEFNGTFEIVFKWYDGNGEKSIHMKDTPIIIKVYRIKINGVEL